MSAKKMMSGTKRQLLMVSRFHNKIKKAHHDIQKPSDRTFLSFLTSQAAIV
jgi:hypothetical protein